MARVTRTDRARKKGLVCGKCRSPINVGDPYLKWSFRFGGKHVRCDAAACRPKPSDLTQSDKKSRLLQVQETIEGFSLGSYTLPESRENTVALVESWKTAAADILGNAASDVQEVASEYRDAAENCHGGVAARNEERADSVDEWGSALENYQSEVEDIEVEDDPELNLDDIESQIMEIMQNAAGEYPDD